MFREPVYILWMAAAVIGLAVSALRAETRRKNLLSSVGFLPTLTKLFPEEVSSRRLIRAVLEICAVGLFFLALAGPQWGIEMVPTQAKGQHIVIAVDTSISMTAEDIKPSRMDKAKRELSALLEELRGNRVGIVAFSGEAHMQCPLTTDIEAAKMFLRSVEAGMLPRRGTATGAAIRLGTRMLSKAAGPKAIVLLTDGEDHDSDPLGAAQRAKKDEIAVFAIGIGKPEGDPIPIRRDDGSLEGYKKDKKGRTVISKLGESILIRIAAITGGAYFRASDSEAEVSEIVESISTLGKSRLKGAATTRYKNRFQYPLLPAILLLAASLLLPERRGALIAALVLWQLSFLSPRALAGPAPAPRLSTSAVRMPPLQLGRRGAFQGAPPSAAGNPDEQKLKKKRRWWKPLTASGWLRRGKSQYNEGDFYGSLESFTKAVQKKPGDETVLFDLGTALHKLQRYEESSSAFEYSTAKQSPARRAGTLGAPEARGARRGGAAKRAPKSTDKKAAKTHYNLGNSLFRMDKFKEAAENYKRAILLDPEDSDARHNLAVALERLKNPPKQCPRGKKKDDKKPKGSKQKQKQKQRQSMNKEDAQRLLEAIREKEKSSVDPRLLRKRFTKKPSKPSVAEKDW